MRKTTIFVATLACALFTACGGETSTELDSDQDGLSDVLESQLKTDAFDVDTDHDGVFDGREHFFGMDPRRPDSDGNGVMDGDEDLDDNGVCERKEHQFGPFERGHRGGDAGAARPEGGRGGRGEWDGGAGAPGERPDFGAGGPNGGADAGTPPWREPPEENATF